MGRGSIMDNLDGKWSYGSFSLVIKGDRYTSFHEGSRYGKGVIVFDDGDFTLTSTHASWFLFLWTPFVEEVQGKYVIAGDDAVTISDIDGRYSYLNRTWKRNQSNSCAQNISLDETAQFLKDKKIWNVSGHFDTGTMPILLFNLGEPHYKLYSRTRGDEIDLYHYMRFKNIVKPEQKFYYLDTDYDYQVILFGNFELMYNDELLLKIKSKQKIDDNYYNELFNFLVVGHEIVNVQLIDGHIHIDFSNGISINVSKEKYTDGLFILNCYDKSEDENGNSIGLSIAEGIIDVDKGNDTIYPILDDLNRKLKTRVKRNNPYGGKL